MAEEHKASLCKCLTAIVAASWGWPSMRRMSCVVDHVDKPASYLPDLPLGARDLLKGSPILSAYSRPESVGSSGSGRIGPPRHQPRQQAGTLNGKWRGRNGASLRRTGQAVAGGPSLAGPDRGDGSVVYR